MKQMTKPISRAELIAILDETLTITRTRNGESFTVPSEQYLDESIQHITDLGYFRQQIYHDLDIDIDINIDIGISIDFNIFIDLYLHKIKA